MQGDNVLLCQLCSGTAFAFYVWVWLAVGVWTVADVSYISQEGSLDICNMHTGVVCCCVNYSLSHCSQLKGVLCYALFG
jgi:hypothetical protein